MDKSVFNGIQINKQMLVFIIFQFMGLLRIKICKILMD